jgi:hypothetical protein
VKEEYMIRSQKTKFEPKELQESFSQSMMFTTEGQGGNLLLMEIQHCIMGSQQMASQEFGLLLCLNSAYILGSIVT